MGVYVLEYGGVCTPQHTLSRTAEARSARSEALSHFPGVHMCVGPITGLRDMSHDHVQNIFGGPGTHVWRPWYICVTCLEHVTCSRASEHVTGPCVEHVTGAGTRRPSHMFGHVL